MFSLEGLRHDEVFLESKKCHHQRRKNNGKDDGRDVFDHAQPGGARGEIFGLSCQFLRLRGGLKLDQCAENARSQQDSGRRNPQRQRRIRKPELNQGNGGDQQGGGRYLRHDNHVAVSEPGSVYLGCHDVSQGRCISSPHGIQDPEGVAVYRSIALVLLAASLWGTTGTAAFFLGSEVPPAAIGAATMGIGGIILALVGSGRTRAVVADPGVRVWLVFGALGAIVYPLTFYQGMASAGIALGNVIALGLGPLVAALLEWVGESRRPAPLWWAAVSGAISGIVLMSLSQVELGGGRVGDLGWGIMFAVIAGVSYGLYTYAFSRVIRAGHHPAGVAGGVFGVAAPVLLLVAFFQGGELLASTERIGLVLYLVAGPMVIAYTAITSALRNLSASSVTSLSLLEPVVATLLAIVVVGERLGGYALWGIGCVLISLVAIAWSLRERP